MDQPAAQYPPGSRVISLCPLSACGWQHAFPPLPDGSGATTEEVVMDTLTTHYAAVEEIVKAHLETHSLLEWVQEVRQLGDSLDGQKAESARLAEASRRARHELLDALLIVTVLVRKAGGSVAVSDADLAAENGMLVREPESFGFTLEVHAPVSENETGIIAYDLEPSARTIPHVDWLRSPLRERPERGVAPRYIPAPQPEGTVRVVLDSAGPNGEPADFRTYDEYPVLVEPYRVFDVPAGQYERWAAAKEAFRAMEEEIEALVSERSRDPLLVPSRGLPH